MGVLEDFGSFGQASDMANFKPTPRVSSIIDNWAPYYIRRVGQMLDGTWTSHGVWLGIGDGEVEIGEIGVLSNPFVAS